MKDKIMSNLVVAVFVIYAVLFISMFLIGISVPIRNRRGSRMTN